MTNQVVSLEYFQSHNEIKDSICVSNDYHSFRYWPLFTGNNSTLSAPPCHSIYYILLLFFMIGKMVGRLGKERDISAAAPWPGSHYFSLSLSEFSSEEIETFHLGETGAIKVRLL